MLTMITLEEGSSITGGGLMSKGESLLYFWIFFGKSQPKISYCF